MLRRLFFAVLVLSAACSSEPTATSEPSRDAVPGPTAGNGDPSRDDANGSRPPAGDPSDPSPPTQPAAPVGPLFRAAADEGTLNTFNRDEAAIEADGTLTIATGKGYAGSDPQPNGYYGGSFYNGGTYRYAVVTSPIWSAATPFDSVTPSFEALTPKGTWVHVKVSARMVASGAWTKEYSLGVWAYDESTIRRHSVKGQADANGDVATDTLELKGAADALRVSVVLFSADGAVTPRLRAVSAIATLTSAPPKTIADDPSKWSKVLAVPKRSQMIYPGGGEAWCSPTSISMLLAYWGIFETPPEAAKRCNDVVYGGTGNWPFNTAHAAAIEDGKLHAMVTRLGSFAQVEPLVSAGIPVAISVSFANGQLGGAPIASTAGHLLVVKGFAKNGDVVVNDPAFASDATVEATYDRAQLTAAWRRSDGTAYLVWPNAKKLPPDPLRAY